MSKKFLAQAIEAILNEDVESATAFAKQYFESKTKAKMNEIADKVYGANVVGKEHTHEVVDRHTKKVVGKYRSASRARLAADKKDNEYGAYRYHAKAIGRDY